MRINRTRRIISLLLLLCVTAFSLSFSVFADRAPEKPQDACADHAAGSVIDQNLVAAEMQEKAGQGILEIESLREESSKHFQLEDGSYQAIAYGAAVHRMGADGKWRDIDNRLYADRTESGRYSTQDGRFSFAESVSADELYIIDDGQYRISFGALLEGSPRSFAVIENHADRKTAAEGLTGEEKLEALKTIDNTTKIMYYAVSGGVDLEYIISGNDVKENIILLQPTEETVFSYRLKLAGLYAELEDDNTVSLKNKNGETVYRLTAPYMYDSAGAGSANVVYTLAEDAEGYIITVEADSKWINSPERVFPVTVDPSVTRKVSLDTYITSLYPTTSHASSSILLVGSNKIAYMFAVMPTIPTYANITYATLSLRYYFASSSGGADIGLYRCVHTWNDGITWNDTNSWSNRGLSATRTAVTTATASSGINQNNPGNVSLNVTSLVRQWYAGGKNYGIGLKHEGGTLANISIHSYESTSSFRATYTISYTTNTSPVIENGTYFIKNKHTDKYADTCQHTYEGGLIEQYEFTADIPQRWIFKYAHFGNYYTIKSADSTTEYYMGVLGDSTSADVNVVLRQGLDSNGTRTMSDGMLWGISTTPSGAYKIQAITGEASDLALCVGAYVFNSNGVDIEQRYYGNDGDYKDEWYLYKISGSDVMFVAITEADGRDRVSEFNPIFGYFFESGSNDFNFIYTNYLSSSSCLSQMSNASIFVSRSHGNYDPNRTWIILDQDGSGSCLYSDQIYNFAPLVDFSTMDIAIYAACYTAENTSTGYNLADATVAAGASYAVGFTLFIYCYDANNWIKYFFYYYCVMGYNVYDACEEATNIVPSMTNIYYIAD